MNELDFQRLLEKKWGDLKHLETERHWFLGAFAVVVACSLAFLSQGGNIDFLWVYVVLSVLSAVGFAHALRISLLLLKLQNDTQAIAQKWRADGFIGEQFMNWWSYGRSGAGPSSDVWRFILGSLNLFISRKKLGGKIPLLGFGLPPSLSALHIWAYFLSLVFWLSVLHVWGYVWSSILFLLPFWG